MRTTSKEKKRNNSYKVDSANSNKVLYLWIFSISFMFAMVGIGLTVFSIQLYGYPIGVYVGAAWSSVFSSLMGFVIYNLYLFYEGIKKLEKEMKG